MHRTLQDARRAAPMLAAALLATACSLPPVGDPSNALAKGDAHPARIHWPAGYAPGDAEFFVHNTIDVAAPAEVVWGVLTEAGTWTRWYGGASDVDVPDPDGLLRPSSTFTWQTMDLNFTSRVLEFEPPYRLSWESRLATIQGYHAWLIVPIEGGVRVVTAEAQHGFLATMQKWFLPGKLHGFHDEWLAGLKVRAEARAADAAVVGP